ncbi:MAG: Lrp/AsnC family transcriptional regulator [Kiritimatiellia bacterium]|jgi:DNA-binding Lrp family transcriptional regulator
MDRILQILREDARTTDQEIAVRLGITPEEVRSRIDAFEKAGVIRGYQALINPEAADDDVRAVIELRVRPERERGFDRLAKRIGRFPEVVSIFLVSGGFDLLLIVRGRNLQEVASFVSARLAPLDGVLSTSTHFMLKTYKDQDVMMEVEDDDERLQVSP